MKYTKLWALALLPFFSCSQQGYEKTSDGVIVSLKQETASDAKKIKLQVINDRIIHVMATPESNFRNDSSLIIVHQNQAAHPFVLEEADDVITLKTAAIKAKVNRHTGEVAFTDLSDKPILREQEGGGKSFKSVKVDDTQAYEMRQVFESPDDESFYGLGQHQADEFNYKGKNEALFQYNTKVSVPFILSNKNYGVLWDNYSLSRFGNAADYAQLDEVFTLYDANGRQGGLTAVYTPPAGKGETITRTESTIYYEDLKTIKNLPQGLALDGSSVTYNGTIEAKESGDFRFHLYYAGYVKVYLNNELVVPERWRTAWNPNSYKFAFNLEAGKQVPLRIEWLPDGGESYLGLRAYTPVADAEQNKLAIFSEMGNNLDYYFVYGENMDEVISGYRTLTGKAPIMPKWAMGFWQSRERYKTQDEIVGALREFRTRRIPIDNIVLDWSYWPVDAWGSHEFDSERFPDPKGMVDAIHDMNAQIMISVWPKFYMNTEHFKEFDEKGWMYKQAINDSIYDWIGYIGSFYDAYSDGARKLFWKQMEEHLYPLGIDAWWMDASEPNVRDCTDMDYRKALCGPTALGPSTQYFNAYALMNAQAIYTGLRNADANKRVFQLTRSGFAGLQRYATATWSGDIGTRWEDMKAQISAGLNFAMSGIPYWTMDIGGFCVEKRYERGQYIFNATGKENDDLKEWRELNARWYQFGAFAPLFRAHGQYPFREVYNIAPQNHQAYKSITYYIDLRYRMMPYIYSLAGMTFVNDYTMMRALVMDYGSDKKVENIGDQFMFGPSLMVCPVYEYGARNREVYFPSTNGWYDFYSGKYIDGGQSVKVDAPYERIPLYVGEGAIIPYGPAMQYVDEVQPEQITLYVYAGKDGAFTLYEDDGVNYDYEAGKYATIGLKYDDALRTFTLGARTGEYEGMLSERTFNVVLVDKNTPKGYNPNAKGISVKYNGQAQDIKL